MTGAICYRSVISTIKYGMSWIQIAPRVQMVQLLKNIIWGEGGEEDLFIFSKNELCLVPKT